MSRKVDECKPLVAGTVECVHTLTPFPPNEVREAGDRWAGLQPTGVSWSSSVGRCRLTL
jgi:hypothetical protein